MIDILLVVDDALKFHERNMAKNYSHYSYFAKRLPVQATAHVSGAGAKLYFNPLIPLNSFSDVTATDDLRRIKYGVISEDNAIEDLT